MSALCDGMGGKKRPNEAFNIDGEYAAGEFPC
jgi:hypothetical protein